MWTIVAHVTDFLSDEQGVSTSNLLLDIAPEEDALARVAAEVCAGAVSYEQLKEVFTELRAERESRRCNVQKTVSLGVEEPLKILLDTEDRVELEIAGMSTDFFIEPFVPNEKLKQELEKLSKAELIDLILQGEASDSPAHQMLPL